jgi:hypothetical protein
LRDTHARRHTTIHKSEHELPGNFYRISYCIDAEEGTIGKYNLGPCTQLLQVEPCLIQTAVEVNKPISKQAFR